MVISGILLLHGGLNRTPISSGVATRMAQRKDQLILGPTRFQNDCGCRRTLLMSSPHNNSNNSNRVSVVYSRYITKIISSRVEVKLIFRDVRTVGDTSSAQALLVILRLELISKVTP